MEEIEMTQADALQRADRALEAARDGTGKPRAAAAALEEALAAGTDANEKVHEVVHGLAHGKTVTVLVEDQMLTSTQAAKALGVSMKILDKMIDAGEIAARRLPQSQHRRIAAAEVIRYLSNDEYEAPPAFPENRDKIAEALASSVRRGGAVNSRR